MDNLREGYTTGACAAAAAKAATKALVTQSHINNITISLPIGKKIKLNICRSQFSKDEASCCVLKDAGDDPDITNGVQIYARVTRKRESGINLIGGTGIGVVTKPGLPVAVGEPAINPIPRQMIISEVNEVVANNQIGLNIEISIPNGRELAQKTLNPQLGIVGGLSILGTSGIVKPMSEEAYKNSLVPQLQVVKALGYEVVVLTPGNIGMKSAVSHGISEDSICQTSNFIGHMLENSAEIGFAKIILWGHPGKLIKVACGNFHTHNRISDGRMETLAAHLALLGASPAFLKKILNCTTTEAAIDLVNGNNFGAVWDILCTKISLRAERFLFNKVQVGTVLLKDRNNILACDENARKMGEELGWLTLL